MNANADGANHAFPPHLRILRQLGEGGTAVVYEAFHTRLNAPVAVKVVRVDPEVRAEACRRILQEARLCANLRDPRIPRVYDVEELPDGTPYLVMELIAGRSVDQILALGPLCYEDAAWLLSELLDALAALHAHGILHRDIKPENLLVQTDLNGRRRLRLIDFGIAKTLEEDATSPRLTQPGMLVGTPHYIAPEILTGRAPDGRIDLYAAAVTFYELLTGTSPFDTSSVGAAIAASLRDAPRPLRQHCPHLSERVEAFIAKGLARDPQRRFQSAREMRAALEELQRQERSPAERAPLRSERFLAFDSGELYQERSRIVRRRRLRRRAEWALVVACALGAAVAYQVRESWAPEVGRVLRKALVALDISQPPSAGAPPGSQVPPRAAPAASSSTADREDSSESSASSHGTPGALPPVSISARDESATGTPESASADAPVEGAVEPTAGLGDPAREAARGESVEHEAAQPRDAAEPRPFRERSTPAAAAGSRSESMEGIPDLRDKRRRPPGKEGARPPPSDLPYAEPPTSEQVDLSDYLQQLDRLLSPAPAPQDGGATEGKDDQPEELPSNPYQ